MDALYTKTSQPEAVLVPLTPREAFTYLQADAAILDIRPEYETDFRVFDVPRVFYLPYHSLFESFHELPGDVFLIVSDSVGNQSKEAVQFLHDQGYSRASYLAGGIVAWDRAGLPLSKDQDYQLTGGCACRLRPQKERSEGSAVAPGKDS